MLKTVYLLWNHLPLAKRSVLIKRFSLVYSHPPVSLPVECSKNVPSTHHVDDHCLNQKSQGVHVLFACQAESSTESNLWLLRCQDESCRCQGSSAGIIISQHHFCIVAKHTHTNTHMTAHRLSLHPFIGCVHESVHMSIKERRLNMKWKDLFHFWLACRGKWNVLWVKEVVYVALVLCLFCPCSW